MKKFFVAIFFALALACSCAPKLVILHVNDTHSHLDPLRSGEYEGRGGVIERAAYADSIRAVYGEDKVLLLHAGDFNQGSSYYTVHNGELELSIVNAMKYDALTLGNHEFDSGLDHLTSRISRISSPFVCCNLDLRSLELGKYVKPYTILNKNGMKIGIVGFITPGIKSAVAYETSKDLVLFDEVEEGNKWFDYLKNQESCDLVIALSHMGYDEDQAFVAQTRNLDLLIGGHSHTFVDDLLYVKDLDKKKVPIITDGCWGLDMGLLKIR